MEKIPVYEGPSSQENPTSVRRSAPSPLPPTRVHGEVADQTQRDGSLWNSTDQLTDSVVGY